MLNMLKTALSKKDKPILNLPQFSFELTDTAEKTLERLKKYKYKIEQM